MQKAEKIIQTPLFPRLHNMNNKSKTKGGGGGGGGSMCMCDDKAIFKTNTHTRI